MSEMATPAVRAWLLATRTPTIHYRTLRDLLHRPQDDPEVVAAREAIMRQGPVPAILAGQTPAGHWAPERSYYTPKYRSTHWSMTLLAELEADPEDERVGRGADFMLRAVQDGAEKWLEKGTQGLSCFWGNFLRYTLRAGRDGRPEVARVVEFLTHDALDGGWQCPHNWGLPCAWGAARALWGLAALPPDARPEEVEATIRRGIAFLLEEHRLHPANYPPAEKVHSLWGRLNFPLFYQADVLFVLRVLGELGALPHPEAEDALRWLAARQARNGRWRGASPYRRRTWAALGDREETGRWVTLHALTVLAQAGWDLPR